MGKHRERSSERSLVCVIQALQGLEILVELQNDVYVRGLLEDCDDSMNVIVKDARIEDVEGNEKHLPLIFLRGSNIRFVHIPDSIDVSHTVEERRLMLDNAALAYMGGKGAAPPKAGESSHGGSKKN